MQELFPRVLQVSTPAAIRAELERVGADSSIQDKIARAEFYLVKLERVSLSLARFLYQELTMEGGQVVTALQLEHVGTDETDVLLCATRYQFNHLIVRLRMQPSPELQTLADTIERALVHSVSPPPALELGTTRFDWTRTYVMGILNVTPDSFSGDALLQPNADERTTVARVLKRAHELVADGADLLDLGGESTRPNAVPVDAETELQRVIPVLRALKNEISVPFSIDTSKSRVAEAALNAGAALVNDVTGLRGDPEMKRVVAAHHAPIVIMHNWKKYERPANVNDVLSVILRELWAQTETALDAGISPSKILVDPGIGFGKTANENLEILNRLGELRVLGLPILIGPSRKGFISKTLGVAVDEREEGTAAAISIGILRGANILRVHDVKAMTRIARMTEAIHAQSSKSLNPSSGL